MWDVVVNRAAGRRSIDPTAVGALLKSKGLELRLHAPGTAQEAFDLIQHVAADGGERICIVGGDGTVNLAVNAVLTSPQSPRPTIAVLPSGTGCDLIRTFGIPQDIAGAADHLLSDDTYPVDVVKLEGEWGTRYFINVGQTGAGAAAAETAPRIPRRLGPIRYPIAFGARLPRFPATSVKVTTEKRVYESEALAVIFANAQFFAGGWNVAPKATLIDGVADMQIINARKRNAPALVPKIIKGTHLRDPAVRRFSAGNFVIETGVPWPIEVDGDYVGNTPVSGRVVPAAIQLKI